MIRNFIIPLIALAGVVFAIYTVVWGDKSPPPVAPASDAPSSPYKTFVAGSGIVEASTENISIGTQIAGIVSEIHVQIGNEVKSGDPLFTIDDRAQRADEATRKEAVQVAEAQLALAAYEFDLAEKLIPGGAISFERHEQSRFGKQIAAGQLAQARAELNASAIDLKRLTVSAPVDGQILQLKVHLGEFAPVAAASTGQPTLILLGNVSPLNLRVDVDENDAWRVAPGATAIGYLRGNREIRTPMKFVRFEPYVVPKKSLTGDSTERVDTRVLQVIFSFDLGALPIFVGQQMDVFIDAQTHTQDTPVVGK